MALTAAIASWTRCKSGPDDFALLVAEALLKLQRDRLPLRVAARAPDLRVVLAVELGLDARKLPVRADEHRQIRDVRLVDEAHVGEVGRKGDGRQRHPQHERCGENE